MFRLSVIRSLGKIRHLSSINKKVYTPTHEWILECSKYNKLGLSKYALEQLDEIVYMEYNCDIGDKIEEGDEPALVESVKLLGL